VAGEHVENPPETPPAAPETPAAGSSLTRPTLLGNTAIGGAVVVASDALAKVSTPPLLSQQSAIRGGTLDPTTIPQYVTKLPILPAMPRAGTFDNGACDVYSIAARQFTQQLMPSGS
jgi:spore coat protein A, manganese oxidase